jgi:hypothetical protein
MQIHRPGRTRIVCGIFQPIRCGSAVQFAVADRAGRLPANTYEMEDSKTRPLRISKDAKKVPAVRPKDIIRYRAKTQSPQKMDFYTILCMDQLHLKLS